MPPSQSEPVTSNLLPCPFCGEAPELQDHCSAWGVHCKCGASLIGPRADQEENHPESYYEPFRQGAIDRWNKRISVETATSRFDAKLDELSKLPRGWDSYDGLPPRGDCLAKARQLIALLPPGHWDVVPMSNGGLQIEQHCGGLDIELMIEGAGPVKETTQSQTAECMNHLPGQAEWCPKCREKNAPQQGINRD